MSRLDMYPELSTLRTDISDPLHHLVYRFDACGRGRTGERVRLRDFLRLVPSVRPRFAIADDYNVVPTDFDIYATRSFKDNALLQPAPRAAYAKLLASGWTDALRYLHRLQADELLSYFAA